MNQCKQKEGSFDNFDMVSKGVFSLVEENH